MSQTFTKTTVLEESLVVDEGTNSVRFTYTNSNKKTFTCFGNKKEWKNLLKDTQPVDAFHKTKKYEIFSNEAILFLQKEGYTNKFETLHSNPILNPENWRELENQMIYFENASNLFYSIDGLLFPIAHIQNYLGGICNDQYDLDKVKEIMSTLKEQGLILSFSEEKIPYYNADKHRNNSIRFSWTLSKEDYNSFFNELKKTERYPSVRFKEAWRTLSWFKEAEL